MTFSFICIIVYKRKVGHKPISYNDDDDDDDDDDDGMMIVIFDVIRLSSDASTTEIDG